MEQLPKDIIIKIVLSLHPELALKLLLLSKAFEQARKDPSVIKHIDSIPDIYQYIKLEERKTLIRLTIRNCQWQTHNEINVFAIHREINRFGKCSGWRHFKPLVCSRNKHLISLEIEKDAMNWSNSWDLIQHKRTYLKYLSLGLSDEKGHLFIVAIPYNKHTEMIYKTTGHLWE
jgi:hypothetical protein